MKCITTYTTVANTKENNKIIPMKKTLMIITAILTTLGFAFAQTTTATDFTTDDCNGVSHNLFSELDAGNVIVISWVMPCAGCVAPSLEAYYAVQSFNTSHAGRVHFYIASDDGQDACSSFNNWGADNDMPLNTTFNSEDLDMEDYDTPGMPKVVVLGGSQHTIFYNQNPNSLTPTFSGVQNAIVDALAAPLAIDQSLINKFEISTYPNPVNNVLNITYSKIQAIRINFSIVDILGKVVLSSEENLSYSINPSIKSINVSALNNGNYFLEISSESILESIPFLVSH